MDNKLNDSKLKMLLRNPNDIAWDPIIHFSGGEIPKFPMEVFPEKIRKFIFAAADSFQVAEEMVAINFISILSAAVGNKFLVNITPQWSEYLNLFSLTIAPPSERKTVVFNLLNKPLQEAQILENEKRGPEIIKQGAEENILNYKRDNLIKRSCKSKDEYQKLLEEIIEIDKKLEILNQTKVKKLDRFVSDITPEKLAEQLEKNNGVVSILTSEGLEVFLMMVGRYSSKVNIEIYLKGFSNEYVSVHRISKNAKNISIEKATLSIGLYTQPVALSEIPTYMFERGLLQRFIYCFPRSLAGTRKIDANLIPDSLRSYYDFIIKEIFMFSASGEKIRLNFGDSISFKKFRQSNENMHLEEISDEEKGWYGKFDSIMARIIGLMHVLDHAENLQGIPTEISEELIERTLLLKKYLEANTKKAFGLLNENLITNDLEYLLDKIKTKFKGMEEIRYQEFWQAVSKKMKKSEYVKKNLKVLEDMNYIILKKDPSRNNKMIIYVNPNLVDS